MNYLSHYYFDRENTSPLYTLGSIFPDLLSNFDRKLKNIPKKDIKDAITDPSDQTTSALSDFRDGIKRHFELDRLFHSGDFFIEQTQWLSREIESLELKTLSRRIYFFAHVLLELILDRVLLFQIPDLALQFYSQLEKSSLSCLKTYFQLNNFLPHYEGFGNYFNNFMERKFILKYSENEMIIKVLNRFHVLINKNDIAVEDRNKLMNKLPNWITKYHNINFESIIVSQRA